MKPQKRYSYWILVVVTACAALPSALPYLKDIVEPWMFGVLGALGVIAQHIKQEVTENDKSDEDTGGAG